MARDAAGVWLEEVELIFGGADREKLADRLVGWHARADATVLLFCLLRELRLLRQAREGKKRGARGRGGEAVETQGQAKRGR